MMKPLSVMPAGTIKTVLTDLDDTLSTSGRLSAAAYASLERLQGAGLRVVIITGRPAGWCDHIARMWPVDAVVGENGAFYFHFSEGRLHKCFHDRDDMRAAARARLDAVGQRILAAVPGAALASDQIYRESDLAIDYCEDVPPLPLETADRIASMMRREGLASRISSIHVNGWIGDYDKLTMTRRLFTELFKLDITAANDGVVFVGDSPNDVPMFRFFHHSVGVANVRRFEARLESPPKYVTTSPAGAGFAELSDHLLQLR